MSSRRYLAPVAALGLGLAACQQQAPAPDASGGASDVAADDSAPAPTETVTETAAPAPTGTGTGTPSPSPTATGTPTPSPTATPSPTGTIPAAARGRWGLVAADCTSTRGDAKGLLVIDATTLRFYESRGTLGAIKERSPTRLRGTFAFSGEGMTWNRDEVLDVQNGGKTLVRREYGADAAPGPFRYTRCA